MTRSAPPRADAPSFATRWWTYQRERFPLLGHSPLIFAFSFCAVSFSRMLRGQPGFPPWQAVLVAFGSCLLFFLQLRIADEFKDFEDDARHRPYRPVPRGLVSLRELAWLFVLAAAVQVILAAWLNVRLLVLLAITWAYLAAMSKEFFVADWLRPRHLLYMVSHMAIMPLVDLYATGADWLPPARLSASTRPPPGLAFFLLASFFNGMVIELGRKIRSPDDEEEGVNTYSRVWGRRTAAGGWLLAMGLTALCATLAAGRINAAGVVAAILATGWTAALLVCILFLRRPAPSRGKWFETCAGLWTLVLYLSLGLLPHMLNRG